MTSSWVLVSSRHTAPARPPPKAPAMRTRVSWTRRGDSKKIRVRGSVASAPRNRSASPALRGTNPSKAKRSEGRPDSASAVRGAEGPGIAETGTPCAMASVTTR